MYIDIPEFDVMKRIIVFPLIAVIAFSGCASSNGVFPQATESSSALSTSISEVTTAETSDTTISERTSESIEAAWDSRLDHDGSGLDEIPELLVELDSVNRICDISIDNDAYMDLEESIDEYEATLWESDESGYNLRTFFLAFGVVIIA